VVVVVVVVVGRVVVVVVVDGPDVVVVVVDGAVVVVVSCDEPPDTVQVGVTNDPSWLPWNPKFALCPTPTLPLYDTFVAVTVLPDVVRLALHAPSTAGGSAKFSVTVQPDSGFGPVLPTVTSSTYPLFHTLGGPTAHVVAALAGEAGTNRSPAVAARAAITEIFGDHLIWLAQHSREGTVCLTGGGQRSFGPLPARRRPRTHARRVVEERRRPRGGSRAAAAAQGVLSVNRGTVTDPPRLFVA
jgi:hypothetical protein